MHSRDGVTLVDARAADAPLIFVNPAFEQMTGYRSDEVVGRNCRFLQGSDRDQPEVETLRAAFQAGAPALVTLRNYRKDGRLFHNELSVAPLRDAAGAVTHFVGIQKDVSERVLLAAERARANADLTRAKHFLEQAARSAQVGGWSLDLRLHSVYASEALLAILGHTGGGLTAEQMVGFCGKAGPSLLLDPPAVDAWHHELAYESPLEGPIWLRSTGFVVYEGGRPARLVGALQDITRAKRLERQRAAIHRRLRVTLRSMGDAVLTTDPRGLVTWLNPVAEALTGWPSDEAQGRDARVVFDVVDAQTRQAAMHPVRATLHDGHGVSTLTAQILRGRSGEERAVETVATLIRGASPDVLGVVLVFRDVTGTRRLRVEEVPAATRDALTGLRNRREFEARLHALNRQADAIAEHAVLFVGLPDVVDEIRGSGPETLQRLLTEVGEELRACTRVSDTVARIGDDDFGVILSGCGRATATRLVGTIGRRLAAYRFDDEGVRYALDPTIDLVMMGGG